MEIIKYITTQEPFFYLKLFLIILTIVLVLYAFSKLSKIMRDKREIQQFNREQKQVIKNKEKLRIMNERARIRKAKKYW